MIVYLAPTHATGSGSATCAIALDTQNAENRQTVGK